MRGVLNLSLSFKFPFVRKTIPLTAGQNGHPIAFESESKPVAWWLVCAETDKDYELDVSWLQYVNGVTYYNGDVDLFEYIDQDLTGGVYYYRFNVGGVLDYIVEGVGSYNQLYFPQTSAYGSWEYGFDFIKQYVYYSIISTTPDLNGDAYLIDPYKWNETIGLISRKNGAAIGTVIKSPADGIPLYGKYDIKVTRNRYENEYHTGAADSFLIQIKGGIFGDEYVDLQTDTGYTNPVVDSTTTTSNYGLLWIERDVKLYNVKKDGVIVPFSEMVNIFGEFNFYTELVGNTGQTKESQAFKIDYINPPTPAPYFPDWSDDWSDDFNI